MCLCLESARLTSGNGTVKSTCLNVDIRLCPLIFVIHLHDTFPGNFFLYFVRHICAKQTLISRICVGVNVSEQISRTDGVNTATLRLRYSFTTTTVSVSETSELTIPIGQPTTTTDDSI